VTSQNVVLATTSASPTDVEGDESFRRLLLGGVDHAYRLAAAILGSPNEAEDAVQDALEKAWRGRSRLRDPDRFEAWFQRIVVNACRDRHKRRRVAASAISLSGSVEDLGQSFTTRGSDPLEETAGRDAISRALTNLTLDQRVAVVMRFYLDLEVNEIARRLRTRPGTVKSRLNRAMNALRHSWENDCG
jgi:RNA polymerase sigma-70 factor, ECF subfamily